MNSRRRDSGDWRTGTNRVRGRGREFALASVKRACCKRLVRYGASAPDDEVLECIRSNGHTLLTRDPDFLLQYRRALIRSHVGIAVFRYPMKMMASDERECYMEGVRCACEGEAFNGDLVVLSTGG